MENLFDKLRADTPVNKNFRTRKTRGSTPAVNSKENSSNNRKSESKNRDASSERIAKRITNKSPVNKKSIVKKSPLVKLQNQNLVKNGGKVKKMCVKPFRVLIQRMKFSFAEPIKSSSRTNANVNKTKVGVKLDNSNAKERKSPGNEEERPAGKKLGVLTRKSSASCDNTTEIPVKSTKGRPRKSTTVSLTTKVVSPKPAEELKPTLRKSKQNVSKTSSPKCKTPSPVVIKLLQAKKKASNKRKLVDNADTVASKVTKKLELPVIRNNASDLTEQKLIKTFGRRFFDVRVRIEKFNFENYFNEQRNSKPKKNLSVSFLEEVEVLGSNNGMNSNETTERKENNEIADNHTSVLLRNCSPTENISADPLSTTNVADTHDLHTDEQLAEQQNQASSSEVATTSEHNVSKEQEQEKDSMPNKEKEEKEEKCVSVLQQEQKSILKDNIMQEEQNEMECLHDEQLREKDNSLEKNESVLEQQQLQLEEEKEKENENLQNEENISLKEFALEENVDEMQKCLSPVNSEHSSVSNIHKDIIENGLDLAKENEVHIADKSEKSDNKEAAMNDSENELDVHFNYSPVSFESAHSNEHAPVDTLSQLSDISEGSLNAPQQPQLNPLDDDEDNFVDPNIMYNANAAEAEHEEMIVETQLNVLSAHDSIIQVPEDVSGLLGDMEDISDKLSSMEVDNLNPTLALIDDTNHDNAHLSLDADSLGVDGMEARSLVESIVNETMN